MKLTLKSLKINNFKGIKNKEVLFNALDTSIRGANAVGKTTLCDAFNWLLFDKDSQGRAKFNIQPLDKENNIIHNLDTEVEAIFEKDGQVVTLTKNLTEKWTRPRGQEEKVLSGTEVQRYIDGVPTKEKDYKAYIESIINQEVFKLISNPYGFENQKWQFKRELLFEMCGTVEDSTISCYSELKKYLGDKTIDDFKKMVSEQKRKLKKDLENIPPRIDELTRSIGEEISTEGVKAVIEVKEARLKELQEQLEAGQAQFDVIREKQKQILVLEAAKNDVIRKAKEENMKDYYLTKDNINSKMQEIRRIQNEQDNLAIKLENARNNIVLYKKDKEELYQRYDAIESETFDEHKKICPTCGQALQEDKVSELVHNFEESKCKRLDCIRKDGQALNAKIVENEQIIEGKSKEFDDLANKSLALKKEVEELNEKAIEPKEIEIDTTSIDTQIDNIRKEIDTFNAIDNTAIKEEIKEIQGDIALKKLRIEQAKKQQETKDRIEELTEEQQAVACKLAECEKQEFLVEKFNRSKCEALEENINSKFTNVKFKLFNKLVNGGIEECCESLINGVPFSNANTASQYAAGIEIIGVICKHYDFYAPIWLDGRESVTEIPKTESQIINLIVDEKCKELTIEQ